MDKIIQVIEMVIRDIDQQEKKSGSKSWKQIALNAKSILSLGLWEFNVGQDCDWEGEDREVGEVWRTGCGEDNVHTNPNYNYFNYCPYCGRSLNYYYAENEYEE